MTSKRRIRIEPDLEPYDVSYVDTWTAETAEDRERIKRETLRQADDEGVWGYIIEEQCRHCDSWAHVDSCWGFIGRTVAIDEALLADPEAELP